MNTTEPTVSATETVVTAPAPVPVEVKRVPIDSNQVVMVRIHGRKRQPMLDLAQSIGQMEMRVRDVAQARAKAKLDRQVGAAHDLGVIERDMDQNGFTGIKVDHGHEQPDGTNPNHPMTATNMSISGLVEALIVAGYRATEIFFVEEVETEGVKYVLQLTLRHETASVNAPPSVTFTRATYEAKETVEQMLPRFIEATKSLVTSRFDLWCNPSKPRTENGQVTTVPGSITINAVGPIFKQPVLNSLSFVDGNLVLMSIPKPPKAKKAKSSDSPQDEEPLVLTLRFAR